MRAGKRDSAFDPRYAATASLLCLLLGACTASGGSPLTAGVTGGASPTLPGIMADVAAQSGGSSQPQQAAHASAQAVTAPSQPTSASQTTPSPATQPAPAQAATDTTEAALPEQVAYVPTRNPADAFAALTPPSPAPSPATTASLPATPTLENAATAATGQPAASPVPTPRPQTAAEGNQNTQTPEPVAAAANAAQTAVQQPATPQKKGFFALLFNSGAAAQPQQASPAQAAAAPAHLAVSAVPTPTPSPAATSQSIKPLIDENAPAKPIVRLASAEKVVTPLASSGPAHVAGPAGSDALPGVRDSSALFEITRKPGTGDNSDVDISEDDEQPVRVASAAGLARLDTHGLMLQQDTVQTACLKPGLVSILEQVEAHFGHKLIVTSGYRSPVHNAVAHGALNSLHMFCAAADVEMPGVSKWQLADYARSLPGRGGVGTYCYTDSVHIDIGPERDWNWRCRRRRR